MAWKLACIFPQQQRLIPQHAGGALVFKLKNAMYIQYILGSTYIYTFQV